MKMRKADPVIAAMVWVRAAVAAAIVVLVVLAMLAQAKSQTSLPEITVTPPPLPPRIQDQLKGNGEGKAGSDTKGDDNRALEQLNKDLKRKADETSPIGNVPPLDARSPDTKTGVVNIPGVQQQYGKNFGNSVVPYRPVVTPAPPIGGHR